MAFTFSNNRVKKPLHSLKLQWQKCSTFLPSQTIVINKIPCYNNRMENKSKKLEFWEQPEQLALIRFYARRFNNLNRV